MPSPYIYIHLLSDVRSVTLFLFCWPFFFPSIIYFSIGVWCDKPPIQGYCFPGNTCPRSDVAEE